MRFTQGSARWRRRLERKKRAVELLGGRVAATHSSEEVPMRQAMTVRAEASPTKEAGKFRAPDPNAARLAFRRRWIEKEARRCMNQLTSTSKPVSRA